MIQNYRVIKELNSGYESIIALVKPNFNGNSLLDLPRYTKKTRYYVIKFYKNNKMIQLNGGIKKSSETDPKIIRLTHQSKYFCKIYQPLDEKIKITHPRISHYTPTFHQMVQNPISLSTDFDLNHYPDDGNYVGGVLMEYIPGCDLETFIKKYRKKVKYLSDKTIICIAKQLAEAIHILHKNGVMHRDLKPENIMVTYEGSEVLIKIIDLSFSTQEEKSSKSIGSPIYMPPEMFPSLEKVSYDHRCDVFSFGLIFYKLIEKIDFFNKIYPKGIDEDGVVIDVGDMKLINSTLHSRIDENPEKWLTSSFWERYPDFVKTLKYCIHPDPKLRINSEDAFIYILAYHIHVTI